MTTDYEKGQPDIHAYNRSAQILYKEPVKRISEYLVETDWFFDASWTFDDDFEVAVACAFSVDDEVRGVADANAVLLDATPSHMTLLGVHRYNITRFHVYNIRIHLHMVIRSCCSILMMESILPRDAMHSADYAVARCLSVHLSVCPSVTGRYSVETAKPTIKLFPPSGSHTILVSLIQTVWQCSNGAPQSGASNGRGRYEKIAILINISNYLENDPR